MNRQDRSRFHAPVFRAPAAGRPLRIAQVAPLVEAVPPARYGGTERVVAYLSEALAALGHAVTLFASADSTAAVERVACCPKALREGRLGCDPGLWTVLQMQALLDECERFDVVHFHDGYLHVLVEKRLPCHITTLHGRLDRDPASFYARHRGPFVAISASQRAALPQARWAGTVHHGLPRDLLHAGAGDGGYLAFVGRVSREKRVHVAIEIARRSGMPLKILAKVEPSDYFEQEIRPLLSAPGVEFLGEGDEAAKQALLAGAAALLFPIDWPEPFGLVMIEALACATPVIAFRRGSVPEIIEHGRSGFVVDDIEQAVAAVRRVREIDRAACRAAFEERFTAQRMASDYVDLYRNICVQAPSHRAAAQTRDAFPSLSA